MKIETKQLGWLRREMEFDRDALDAEKRTVELAFSSEAPVERAFGVEILDHSPENVRMDRLSNAAPLLLNHDPDKQIGVVESARVDGDKKGRAVVRFGNSPLAQEIFQDVKDGIRRLVSVGYRVHDFIEDKAYKAGKAFRAIPWEPMEISIVSVPADVSVGIGRDAEQITTRFHVEPEPTLKVMPENQAPEIEVVRENARKDATSLERSRIANIHKAAENAVKLIPTARDIAIKAINDGSSEQDFARALFEAFPKQQDIQSASSAGIGMSDKEVKRYSITKAIRDIAFSKKLDGIEREAHEAAFKMQHNPAAEGASVIIPYDVLARSLYGQRDQLVGTNSIGGFLRPTEHMAGSFIDILRNKLVLVAAGARYMPGLVGTVTIPRRLTGSTPAHVTEAESISESQGTFDQVTLTPKCAAAYVQYSIDLLKQSAPGVDQLVADDLLQQIQVDIESKVLHGSGSGGQPTGLASVSGIGSVTGGANGAAPTYANIVSLETEVAVDNADIGALKYVTNTAVRGKLKVTPRQGSGVEGNFVWATNEASINGYGTHVTNNVASNLTKGTSTTVCSAVFFGNWSDLIVATWGGLELLVDPYTNAQTRLINLRGFQYYAPAVRRAQSFAAMLDALTA